MQRAISCTSALSEPIERAQKLYDLGFHDGILADLVAYGRLVGLLTEFPEKQKEVVAHVTKKKPEMVQSEQNVRSTTITYVECLKRLKQSYPTDYMDMIACIKNNDTEQ